MNALASFKERLTFDEDDKPKLPMLDEPSLCPAPRIVRKIFFIVAVALKRVGMSILLVEHNGCAALRVTDYGHMLETGETVLERPAAVLAGNSRLIQIFLGMSGRFRCVAP